VTTSFLYSCFNIDYGDGKMPKIKNWKRIRNTNTFVFWLNEKNKASIGLAPIKKGVNWNAPWRWQVFRDFQILKEFELRNEAYTFATKWIKEHPLG